MYLIDTNVISEARKREKANPGVIAFFKNVVARGESVYLSVISVGELQRGVGLIAHRGDVRQAKLLEVWLKRVLAQFAGHILSFDTDAALVWGYLRVPHAEHELDRQIAAIALVNDLIVVTRNIADFQGTGVQLQNPFAPA